MDVRVLLTLAVSLMSATCDSPEPGDACTVTGDGFSRQDPCEHSCVDWAVDCADGTSVTPSVCSAGECSDDADCPTGFSCAPVGSVTYGCLPSDTCDGGF